MNEQVPLEQSSQAKQIAYLVALSAAPGIGPKKTEVLLKFFKTPQEVWEAENSDLEKILGKVDYHQFLGYRKKIDVETNFDSLSKQGIKVLTILEDTYPELLSQISSPPTVIYYKGDLLSTLSRPCIAVVGTRLISIYGQEVTQRLVEGLVSAGLTVVSGLAKGVDSVAHRATLDADGKTVAVLGSGLNHIFPVENHQLAERIVSSGGAVISEYPPEMDSLPGNFPARNRIISGLSLGVLVTEAAEDSGSLITADFATEQGRDVFAVPGPITSKLSQGPSKLLKVGAKLVTGVEDILEELKIEGRGDIGTEVSFTPSSPQEEKIWQSFEDGAKSIDQIVRETGLSAAVVSSTITLMEINGFLRHLGTGVYSRK
jgi:DNA processing protein